ncbi:claudin-10 isoform X2 [Scophthalmus maximus]|uniref:claudin-10 isoform X2 n=1 Tax=Scophthalmus maximus TaxID=52904 RepID=UPI0015E12AE5|nr:claudin-10 isoform X2 [Scophthalmus maximus]
MGYRTVVMYMEIGCFVTCVTGWILVCSTMPTEIWTWSEVDSIVLTTSNYFSNLWKDCISDSTGVSDCKGIPSMLALNLGMKCTKIGGSEISNARVTFAGGMNYFIGGMCSMIAFSYYGNKIRSEFDDPHYKAQKFEIGVGVFVGWGGSTLLVVGGLIYSIFAGREGCHSSSKRYPAYQYPDAYTVVPTRKGPASLAGTKRSESRKSRNTSRSGDSSISGVTSITRTTASNSSGVTSITKTTDSNEYV